MSSLKIGIVGASGYTGVELIRLLHVHPNCGQVFLFGNESAGKYIDELYPGLLTERFENKILPVSAIFETDLDVLFLAVAHGAAEPIVNQLEKNGFKGLLIDLSTDFRWKDGFTYGLAEWFTADIKKAKKIANPGCFATAIQLALFPVLENGVNALFHITALTGSTGSGAGLKPGVQFSERYSNVKAYKVLEHQHEKEIKTSSKKLFNTDLSLQFTPVSGPFTRGIWATISFTALKPNLFSWFEETYYNKPFVRLTEGALPELKQVTGSNFTEIGVVQKGAQTVIGVAIDNLVKGASGQAIQNMNLALGLDETTGLMFPGYIF
ncbi:N-acetyl-gamma-glutamyl-phosphate reductase [bacterium]|nr:MAG: N-acetyl-gamma-glutamyl-phosphate reductase [bacterium]